MLIKLLHLNNLLLSLIILFISTSLTYSEEVFIEIDNPRFSEKGLSDRTYEIKAEKGLKSDNELKLTEREIETILFLKNENKPVKVEILQKKVWKYEADLETHTVETHIYRLRKKIKDTFNDDSFIQSEKLGYIIHD